MKAKLKQIEQDLIAGAIQDAKTRTKGEIITVLARQSDHYSAVAITISLVLAGIISLAFYWVYPIYRFYAMSIIELTIFFLSLTILELTGAHIFVVPTAQKMKAVRRLAQEQFLLNKLHMTQARASILILVSQRERRVELIADSGIVMHEQQESWEAITQQLSQNLRSQPLAAAVKIAAESSATILEKHFPADRF